MNVTSERQISPVATVIVAYNNSTDVLSCLHSLLAMSVYPAVIAIVDNSQDNALYEKLHLFCKQHALEFPQDMAENPNGSMLYSHRSTNDGFAAANNFAVAALKFREDIEYFWFLNPDTIVAPQALQALIETAQSDANIGVTGSTLIQMASSCLQTAAGSQFNPRLGTTKPLLSGIPLQEIARYPASDIAKKLGDINGASMLVRKSVIAAAGGMYDFFFLYLEETEWCIRIRKCGFALAWAPESVVYHKDGGTRNGKASRPAYADYLMLRNRLLVLRAHYPHYVPLAATSYGVVALKRILRGQLRRLPLVWQALVDGLSGKAGKPDFTWLRRFD